MLRSKGVLAIVLAVAVVTSVKLALAQDSRPANPGPGVVVGGGAWGGAGQQMDPEQMKKMVEQFRAQAAARMKEALGANDDEWKVLQPKIEKVQELTMQGSGMGMRIMPFMAAGDPKEVPDVQKKFEALRKVLQNKDAKPADISTALTEYRDARAKSKEELEKAQKELKELLTVKQEAQLVGMGVLP